MLPLLSQKQCHGQVVIDDRFFDLLRKIILELSGITIPDSKRYLLENRLSHRLRARGCKNFEEYYYLLHYGTAKEEERVRMIECITTNETFFFREPAHLRAFREEILPALIRTRRAEAESTIRIWSAACSTGEEPYTLAMLLQEMDEELSGVQIQILASDINESVIRSARRGIFGENSLRHLSPARRRDYFVPAAGGMRLRDDVKSAVRFANLNLMDRERLMLFQGMDVIFCKNVLIYFDMAVRKEVVANLYDVLAPQGILMIGQSESLHDISRSFLPVYMGGAVVYKKE